MRRVALHAGRGDEIVVRWGKRPIREITRRDVVGMLEEVVDSGRPFIAHHLLAYTRKLFNWAIARDIYALTSSPCDRVKPKDVIGTREPRQRVLKDNEMRSIWALRGNVRATHRACQRVFTGIAP